MDNMKGAGGRDTLFALAGKAVLAGGDGSDTVDVGMGVDRLYEFFKGGPE